MNRRFLIDVIYANRGTSKTLYEYRVNHPETTCRCLNCGKKLDIESRFFCEEPTIRDEYVSDMTTIIGISKCAYDFYSSHPEIVLEWATQ